jgi:hypothetical protein
MERIAGFPVLLLIVLHRMKKESDLNKHEFEYAICELPSQILGW